MIDMLDIGMFQDIFNKESHSLDSCCSIEMPSGCHIVVLLGDQKPSGINRSNVCRRKTGTPALHDDWPLRPTINSWEANNWIPGLFWD